MQRQRMNIHATALAALISRLEWKGEEARKKRSKKRAVSDMDVPVTVDMGRPKPDLEAFKRPKQLSGPRMRHERHGQLSPDNALGAVSADDHVVAVAARAGHARAAADGVCAGGAAGWENTPAAA